MSQTFNINGTGYPFPDTGDENWGAQVTNWASAVTTGMLQKAGGAFTLTADVNFGASFGLKSQYFVSRGTNTAVAGVIRLANTENVSWRNAANNADLPLSVNSSNELTFNGNVITAGSGAVPTTNGGTGLTSYTAGDTVYYASGTAFTKLAIGAANTVNVSTGSAPSWSTSLALASTISASNLSGTNTGDVTLAPVGNSPAAAGASLSGQVLTLQPANGSNPGVITAGTQTIGGAKTFSAAGVFSSTLEVDSFLGVMGGPVTGAALAIRAIALTGSATDNYGVFNQVLGNSSGTSSLVGVYSAPRSAASAYTVAYRAAFFADAITKGAGSTITRDIGVYVSFPSEGTTGGASIADNLSFSGSYFINSTSTNPSLLSGSLTVANTGFTLFGSSAVTFLGKTSRSFSADSQNIWYLNGNATIQVGQEDMGGIKLYTDGGSGTTRGSAISFNTKIAGAATVNEVGRVTNAGIWDLTFAGMRTKLSTDNTANPPTKAQLTSAFGSPSTVGSGFIGIIDDNGAHTNEYICWSDGTEWFYATGTKAA